MNIKLCKICDTELIHNTEREESVCESCHLLKAGMLMCRENGQTQEEAWDSNITNPLPYRVGVKFWDYTWGCRTLELAAEEWTGIFTLLDEEDVITISKLIAKREKVKAIRCVRLATDLKLKPAWEFINRWLPSPMGKITDRLAKEAAQAFKKSWVKANMNPSTECVGPQEHGQ